MKSREINAKSNLKRLIKSSITSVITTLSILCTSIVCFPLSSLISTLPPSLGAFKIARTASLTTKQRRLILIVQAADTSSNSASQSCASSKMMHWYQHEISITAPSRGCHLITTTVQKAISKDVANIKIGMANLFVQHTSASLTINENADPDVRRDLEMALNKIVPESWNRDGTFKHTMEGDDDMPGHVKSSMMGVSLNIPITDGRLALGTWQGIYLNEHRNQGGWGGGHTRKIVITLQGKGWKCEGASWQAVNMYQWFVD